jgi:glycosyltransferase A (GT-A) superfamily protein (DUF2064 family)
VLRARAVAWGRSVGGPLEVAHADGLAEALAGHAGPVLLVAPDVPGLSADHRDAALGDLAAGVLVSSGATGDGSPFLIALASAEPRLLRLVGASFETVVATTLELGGELGMLRAERRLTSLADAHAVHADPLAPPELRELLEGLG